MQLFTDSAGGEFRGFGIHFAGKWAYSQWPQDWFMSGVTRNMTVLELFPVIVAIQIWKMQFSNSKILFYIDNMSVVNVVNTVTSRSLRVIKLVRKLVLTCLEFNILIKAKHIPSKSNSIADAISRSQWGKFRLMAPTADPLPTPLPRNIWDI